VVPVQMTSTCSCTRHHACPVGVEKYRHRCAWVAPVSTGDRARSICCGTRSKQAKKGSLDPEGRRLVRNEKIQTPWHQRVAEAEETRRCERSCASGRWAIYTRPATATLPPVLSAHAFLPKAVRSRECPKLPAPSVFEDGNEEEGASAIIRPVLDQSQVTHSVLDDMAEEGMIARDQSRLG
jgi:hypothetical protein